MQPLAHTLVCTHSPFVSPKLKRRTLRPFCIFILVLPPLPVPSLPYYSSAGFPHHQDLFCCAVQSGSLPSFPLCMPVAFHSTSNMDRISM